MLSQEHKPTSREYVLDKFAYDLWRGGDSDDPFHEHLLNAVRVAIAEEVTLT